MDPATSLNIPPDPLFPLPTDIVIDPPLPDVAVPLRTEKAPDFPLLAEPVRTSTDPLMPDAPALALCILMLPLEDAEEYPEATSIPPPVAPSDNPAITLTFPPTSTDVEVPRPAPPRICISPPSPPSFELVELEALLLFDGF